MNIALFNKTKEGLSVSIRVTPKAKQNRIGECFSDPKGRLVLKVYITAAPIEGKANEAVIELLAKYWNLKKSQIILQQGATHKHKVFLIAGNFQELLQHMAIQKPQVKQNNLRNNPNELSS